MGGSGPQVDNQISNEKDHSILNSFVGVFLAYLQGYIGKTQLSNSCGSRFSPKYKVGPYWVNLSKRGGKEGVFRALAGLLRGATLPAREKPRPSRLFYSDLHSIYNRFPY